MAPKNLYRAGSTNSPLYEKVRPGKDVILTNGKIKSSEHAGFTSQNHATLTPFIDSGGITTFSVKDASWVDNKTWVLHMGELVNGLEAVNTVGTHYLIAPSHDMTLEEYKLLLTSLNLKARLRDKLPPAERDVVVDSEAHRDALATESPHADYAKRFLVSALKSFAEGTIPDPFWDANDFRYIDMLADGLKDGRYSLEELIWDPAGPSGGRTRRRAFIAHSVISQMAYEVSQLKVDGTIDEEAEAELANDHRFLRILLRLDDPANPLANFDTSAIA